MLTTILDRKCEEMRGRQRVVEIRRPDESFHQRMMGFLLDEGDQRARLARCLFHHVRSGDWHPTRTTAAALRGAGLDWCLVALPVIFQEYAGGALIDMAVMAPEIQGGKKAPRSKWQFRGEYEKFVGVLQVGARFRAAIKLGGKERWLGSFATVEEAASAFDSASLRRGTGGKLNFRTSLDATAFTLEAA